MAETGTIDLFFFLGTNPAEIFNTYTSLTGRPVLPQLFAIGYHQCRWNYLDETDVSQVDAKFDELEIPYDVLWLDIEHTDGKRYFTWDPLKFPTPERMQNDLASRGRKMVTIIDPHIKVDDNYPVFKAAKDLDFYVKDVNGNDFEGWCWPGSSQWLDYLNPKCREYWAQRFLPEHYVVCSCVYLRNVQSYQLQGSTLSLYTWNDMNEPSVFTGPEITMPKDNLHFGRVEHRNIHNAYGMLQVCYIL